MANGDGNSVPPFDKPGGAHYKQRITKLNTKIHKIIVYLEHALHDKEIFPDDNDDLHGKKSLVEQAAFLLEYLVKKPSPVGGIIGRNNWSCNCNFYHDMEKKKCDTCGAVRPATEYRERTVKYLAFKDRK